MMKMLVIEDEEAIIKVLTESNGDMEKAMETLMS